MDIVSGLRTFLCVVEAGSLTGGARELGLSVASVSRQLAALEEELGEPLLERSTRSMALTEAGRGLVERAGLVLEEIASLRRATRRGGSGLRGTLEVIAPGALGVGLIAPALPLWAGQHPALGLRLQSGSPLQGIGAGVIGVGWGASAPRLPGARTVELGSLGRVLAASPAYLSARGVPASWEALAGHALLSAPAPGEACWEGTAAPKAPLQTDDPLVAQVWATAGLGIGCLPRCVAQEALRSGRLEALPCPAPPPLLVWALTSEAAASAPEVEAVLGWLGRLCGGGGATL